MPFWKRFNGDFAVKPIVLKLEEDSTVIKEEKVILSLKARTYGVPIMLDGEERGIVFLGEGDYLINSRVKTYIGVYSKQYIDTFKDWGVIIGKAEKWAEARTQFTETKETPEGFSDTTNFLKEVENNLSKMIDGYDAKKGIERTDWFYRVKGGKEEANLHYKDGKVVFKGCHTRLVSTSEEQLVLKEGDVELVLHKDNAVLKSKEGKLVTSGETVISDIGVISDDKIVTRGLVGKYKDLVEKVKFDALSLLPKVLEELGYKLE